MLPSGKGGDALARLMLLWAMVLSGAGLTIWVGLLAMRAHAFSGQTLMALLPLLMLISLGLRGLKRKRDE